MTTAIFQLPNGSIAVDTAAPGYPNISTPEGWTRLPDGLALPTVFRDCWRYDASIAQIYVDMTAARAQVMAACRRERDLRLAQADQRRAQLADIGTDTQRADHAVYRQALRDLPVSVQADIDAIADPVALAAYTVAYPMDPT
jgi:hypothetical protein